MDSAAALRLFCIRWRWMMDMASKFLFRGVQMVVCKWGRGRFSCMVESGMFMRGVMDVMRYDGDEIEELIEIQDFENELKSAK